ncbi:amidohydrolase family protein [Thermodesulfobacteriota bacterium]
MTNQAKSHPAPQKQPIIHRAPWVVADTSAEIYTNTRDTIEDGAVVVSGGIIKAVGKFRDISREFSSLPIQEHESKVLAPALINSHCHLELSYLNLTESGGNQTSYSNDFTLWIRELLKARDNFLQSTVDAEKQILSDGSQVLREMAAEGVGFVGDIGNSLASRTIGPDQNIEIFFLLELLGLTKKSEVLSLARLGEVFSDESLEISCTAHAPYSVTPALIQAIKDNADRRGHIFSIHVAESKQEVEFLQTGTGRFLDFLHERGAWDSTFKVPGMGAVHYLESLGVLNDKTLCVHVVHVDHEEIGILALKKAKVCLCPGSNRFLGSGKAPVTEFLAHGILPSLGTDSKASNPVLSIWREMRLLREDHPGLLPETVFSMATRGGAEAWGIDSALGTLEPGKQARILKVNCQSNMHSSKDILEYMTTAGESLQVEWVE